MSEIRQVSFTLKNERDEQLPVFVEPWPEHYKLRKNETLKIAFEPRTDVADVVEIVAHSEGLSIYPNFVEDAEITINDEEAADRSWAD